MMKIILLVAVLIIIVLLYMILSALSQIHDAVAMLSARPMPVDPVAQAISDHLSTGRNPDMNAMGVAGGDDHVG